MYVTQWVTEGDFIIVVTPHIVIKKREVCMRTNHPLTLYWLTYISLAFLKVCWCWCQVQYYMCAYAWKCFTFTPCSSSCPLIVWTCDGHLRMTCRWVNQERKKLTFLNLCCACESSIHEEHKKCVTNFHWKLKGKRGYPESLHWRIILKWI
jgi:hypothetical protein